MTKNEEGKMKNEGRRPGSETSGQLSVSSGQYDGRNKPQGEFAPSTEKQGNI